MLNSFGILQKDIVILLSRLFHTGEPQKKGCVYVYDFVGHSHLKRYILLFKNEMQYLLYILEAQKNEFVWIRCVETCVFCCN